MASISSLGVGSNLPLDQLLTDLTKNEKGRLTPITKQQSANSAKLTAYGTLKSALEKFQTANTALNKADLFKSTVRPAPLKISKSVLPLALPQGLIRLT